MPKQQSWSMIKCPHCGMEYHPAEIFYSDDLFGNPETVLRDAANKVVYVEYKTDGEPVTTTRFVCDNCEKAFKVTASVTFKVEEEIDELDFSSAASLV